jgi:hypothetical protein
MQNSSICIDRFMWTEDKKCSIVETVQIAHLCGLNAMGKLDRFMWTEDKKMFYSGDRTNGSFVWIKRLGKTAAPPNGTYSV